MEAIVEKLIACLQALDEADQHVAAAHVNAAIEALIADKHSVDSETAMES